MPGTVPAQKQQALSVGYCSTAGSSQSAAVRDICDERNEGGRLRRRLPKSAVRHPVGQRTAHPQQVRCNLAEQGLHYLWTDEFERTPRETNSALEPWDDCVVDCRIRPGGGSAKRRHRPGCDEAEASRIATGRARSCRARVRAGFDSEIGRSTSRQDAINCRRACARAEHSSDCRRPHEHGQHESIRNWRCHQVPDREEGHRHTRVAGCKQARGV